jgi:hypothetical protein
MSLLAGCLALVFAGGMGVGGEAVKHNVVVFPRESSEGVNWETVSLKMGQKDVACTLQGLGFGDSKVVYKLDGNYDVFESWVGYLSTVSKGRSCRFAVLADGAAVFTSDPILSGEEPIKIRVPVKGAHIMTLEIKPSRYGATLGAAFGDPVLYTGVSPEELKQPLTLDINGKRSQMDLPGGVLPKEVMVPIPLNSGTADYRVHVVSDTSKNKIEIVVDKAKP